MMDDPYGIGKIPRRVLQQIESEQKKEERRKLKPGETRILRNEVFDKEDSSELLRQLLYKTYGVEMIRKDSFLNDQWITMAQKNLSDLDCLDLQQQQPKKNSSPFDQF
jgi:hypothetical protein